MRYVVKAIIRYLLLLVIRLEVHGRENFPEEGAYIVAPNHISAFDTPTLLIVIPHMARAFAAEKHRHHPFYAPLLTIMRSIWVRRGEVDRRAIREALEALEQGDVLGVAPEGTRARGPYALQPGKTGVAYLATRADVPVVPVGITGTERVKENLPRLRCTHVQVNVGEPIHLPKSGRVSGAKLDEYTELIMHRIAALLPEEYRGVYA